MAFTDHPSILSECAKSLLEKDPKNIFALSINRLITKYCNLKIEVYDNPLIGLMILQGIFVTVTLR